MNFHARVGFALIFIAFGVTTWLIPIDRRFGAAVIAFGIIVAVMM